MTIETEYDLGDTVWLMCHNKAIESTIEAVVRSTKTFNAIGYWVEDTNERTYLPRLIFPTKQDLINSL